MLSVEVGKKLRQFKKDCNNLKNIVNDTNNSLNNISKVLQLGKDFRKESTVYEALKKISNKVERVPHLFVFGQSSHSKALFINLILQQQILPLNSNNWRSIIFKYNFKKSIHLTLNNDIEIVENLKSYEETADWETVPENNIQRNEQEEDQNYDHNYPTVEIGLNHKLLEENFKIIVPPDNCHHQQLVDILEKLIENVLPVIIYTVSEDILSDLNIHEIRRLKELYSVPFLFVSVTNNNNFRSKHGVPTSSSVESISELDDFNKKNDEIKLESLRQQLSRLGYLTIEESDIKKKNLKKSDRLLSRRKKSFCLECSMENTLICDKSINKDFVLFLTDILKFTIVKLAVSLSEIHNSCLRKFILCAFDMAREIQITPKRILYAQDVELKLYKRLSKIAGEQHEEITVIIQKTLINMKSNVAEVLEGYTISDITSPKVASMEIQQLVLKRLSESVAMQIVQSVGCLHEGFTGTLQRCLESLEKNCHDLETTGNNNLSASDAVKQIIHAAYTIDLKTPSSLSIVQNFMDKLRKFLSGFGSAFSLNNNGQFQCTLQWQLQIVTNMLDSFSASKLAKTISIQFQEHVNQSHEAFQSAMRSLENQLSDQLEQTEEQRKEIRKKHAPKFARLSLESTSLGDLLKWGMPKQIREIGRGQYGIVSSCEPWGKINPCAYKSVVPPDGKHWNDLAMEFYYTRTIPEHPRIVKLRGSIIDYHYYHHAHQGLQQESSPAVLLIMERMVRDLHWGLKNGLSWLKRLRIAIDVVEGIRYLHSQGLIHRDIKLKNVLLDADDRAKLTDFGFCIPEAMMSGSIVGTPVHMSPELLSRQYDSSVDVYAFGILFWYICAGQVKLPKHFHEFENKEELWNNVRRGTRPERLNFFNDSCWILMQQCWNSDPAERPLLGNVQPQLEQIFNNAKFEEALSKNKTKFVDDDDDEGKCCCSSVSPKTSNNKDAEIFYKDNNSIMNLREY